MSLVQDIFRQSHSPILVTIHQKANLTRAILKKFLETADDGVVGLAPGYGPNCVLSVLAVATSTTVLVVQFTKLNGKKRKKGKNGATQANELDLLEDDEKFGKTSRLEDVSLRAWCAWRAATLTSAAQRLNAAPRISTQDLDETRLSVLAKMVRDTCRLEALKPTRVKNDIEREYKCKKDQLHVKSTRFKTRIADRNQRVEIQTMKNGQRVTLPGTITRVDGRAAQITHKAKLQDGPIKVTTVGKEAPTNAEAERADIILSVLQGKYSLEIPFFQAIWLPRENPAWRAVPSTSRSVLPIRFQRPLNDSQKRAGTGKTTVIAAAVTSMDAIKDRRGKSMWLVAQSNVAVKNIAEKLASVGFFDFKLLVSKDFHYDWHEHIYEKIEPNVIRSDNLAKDTVAIGRQLMGTRVILCTLSMLSNDRIAPITRMVPLQIVIIDEASQVEIGSFLPLVHRFSRVLEKLVFIGDDKQLAPYGQGDIDSLKSVFEMEHLREGALFLDTQYRLVLCARP
ncbi:hypothetical protein C8J57DRAFT_1497964 [Mycena rebaudengoi]|nr:hypothetical protein C8J57DRAFT_1497964 [Mycena rebaudengoi]